MSIRILSWDDIADTAGTPSDLHEEYSEDLVYRVSAYYRAMGTGDPDRMARAAEMLRDEESGYWDTFGFNPRDIIDVQDSAVIAAHADLVAPVVFNAEADEVAAAFAVLTDLDNDIHYPLWTFRGAVTYAHEYQREADAMAAYRSAYLSGPASSTEVVQLRRALSVWTIASRRRGR